MGPYRRQRRQRRQRRHPIRNGGIRHSSRSEGNPTIWMLKQSS